MSQILPILIPIVGIIIAVVVFIILAKSMYKIADVDKALIITGGKKPRIITSGGAFVIPIIRKADFFDLCMLTVSASKDQIMTKTAVSIVVDWTAQIRPDRSDLQKLETAIISFKERGPEGIKNDVRLTLTGALRNVVASMTPEEVLADKEAFTRNVEQSVTDEMSNMGLELVSLNIQDITDSEGYFDNIAFLDKAEKQKTADIKEAETDRITREEKANQGLAAQKAEAAAERDAAIAKMEAEQVQNDMRRETDLKIAENKIATETAQANAEVAKELQQTIRAREVEEQRGAVAITRQEQLNLAAQREKAVAITRAEAEKATKEIAAAADASVEKIAAENKIAVAERIADSQRKKAQGDADVQRTEAEARENVAEHEAAIVRFTAEAAADRVRAEGQAEADANKAKLMAEAEGIRARQAAEAEGIKAKKLAEAEGERALAEARAANDKVNFEIERLKIDADARVKIATATAEIMADIGQHAEFVNIGGNNIPGINGNGGTGNVLVDTLMAMPGLMKVLDTESKALNGVSATEQLKEISDSALSGVRGLTAKASDEDSAKSTEE